jgi:hypothetical protein
MQHEVIDTPASQGMCLDDWVPPVCDHGNIILGCDVDGCEKQDSYLADIEYRMSEYERLQIAATNQWMSSMFPEIHES